MRSRNVSPGFAVTRMTMRSLSTRVPPVTPERSPPDSRITGADSPVTADSSTEAMPSTISPSAGITSPASQTTRSPARRSGAGRGSSRRRRRAGARSWWCASCAARRPGPCRGPRRAPRRSSRTARSATARSRSGARTRRACPWAMSTTSWPVTSTETTQTERITGLRRSARGSSLRNESSSAARAIAGSSSAVGGGGHQSLPVRASVSGPRARAGKKERAPTSRITPIRRPTKIGEAVGMLPLEAGRVLLRRERAGQAERGQDHEEAAEHHRRAEQVVVVVRRRRQPGEGRAVVVPGRGERVEDLAEAVRTGVERAGQAVVEHRREADRDRGSRPA